MNRENILKQSLIQKWPMYMVVTENHAGIYDNMTLLYKDTIGLECHYCTKYRISECFKDFNGYYKYHYKKYVSITPDMITEKNKLFKVRR